MKLVPTSVCFDYILWRKWIVMKVGDEWMIIKICSMLLSQCTFVWKYSLITIRYYTVECLHLSVCISDLWPEITNHIFQTGVSCDSCLKNNFRGRRYKCLICIDYDLCAACYESGATTNQHTTEHPMQCILSRSDFGEPLILWIRCATAYSPASQILTLESYLYIFSILVSLYSGFVLP